MNISKQTKNNAHNIALENIGKAACFASLRLATQAALPPFPMRVRYSQFKINIKLIKNGS